MCQSQCLHGQESSRFKLVEGAIRYEELKGLTDQFLVGFCPVEQDTGKGVAQSHPGLQNKEDSINDGTVEKSIIAEKQNDCKWQNKQCIHSWYLGVWVDERVKKIRVENIADSEHLSVEKARKSQKILTECPYLTKKAFVIVQSPA